MRLRMFSFAGLTRVVVSLRERLFQSAVIRELRIDANYFVL